MRRSSVAAACLWAALSVPTAGQVPPAPNVEGIAGLLRTIETGLETGDPDEYLSLLAPIANRNEARAFATTWFDDRITRAVVRERERYPLAEIPPGDGYELYVDIFTEFGREARLGSWRLDVRRAAAADGGAGVWQIAAQNEISAFTGLHRLQLNDQQEFAALDLTIRDEDLLLSIPQATVFISEIPAGTAALVVMGRGEMTFSPAPAAERGQVKIFSGDEVLRTRIDAAFVRMNPDQLDARVSGTLVERPVDARDLRRAREIFDEELTKSFSIDLEDLSPEIWSTIPQSRDLVAEIRTRGYDTLTYTRLGGDLEDLSLFDRERNRTISLYASPEKLAERGRFYSEDARVDYDVLGYDVEAWLQPDRAWIDGQTTLQLAVKSAGLGTFVLRLARELAVSSVVSRRFGRLLALRGFNQNTVIVQLPEPAARGSVFDVVVTYSGRLPPQPISREALAVAADPQVDQGFGLDEAFAIPIEPSWLYSVNSFWYAQSLVNDYAPARLRLHVPEGFSSVATGAPVGEPEILPRDETRGITWRRSTFVATQPVRYLGWLVSRLSHVADATVALPAPPGGKPPDARGYDTLALSVEANPRQEHVGREITGEARDILAFYGSLLGEFPYPRLALAVIEDKLPGGHSPPYFARINQPPPLVPMLWRRDPSYFPDFKDFFLAHELAHQWWGQAVGWKNFHEQWLSEGLSQYFAVLYYERENPDGVHDVLRQLRRWSRSESDQGPVYLGYRLGHIQQDPRIFRALVYNKGAAVLHMLRRLVGDEAFFESLRRFYTTWRFRKAGTDDLRASFEEVTGRPLNGFFEHWIYGQELPRIRSSWRVEGDQVVLTFEQLDGASFVVPVTVSLEFQDRTRQDRIVVIDATSTEVRLPLRGQLRNLDVNDDDAALAEFVD